MGGFDRPAFLLFLLALPVYVLASRAGAFRKVTFPLTLSDWNGVPLRWTPPFLSAARAVSRVFLGLAFALLVIGGAGPVRYRNESMYGSRGNSVLFALDASPSMAARDMAGESRLDAARASIRAFVLRRPGDACGLVVFGSEAALLVPPTRDHDTFLRRLDSVRIGELGDGTALGLGLAVAAAHLTSHESVRAAAVLLTDGENNAGEVHPLTAASVLRDRGIALYVAGIGSRGDVPLEYADPDTGTVYSGVLDSGFDEASLREIALRGGGQYVTAAGAEDLAEAFAVIGSSVPSSPVAWTRTVEQRLETGVLAAAAILAALAWIIRRVLMGAIL